MKACPFCAEQIQDDAIFCRFCGRELVHRTTPEEEARMRTANVLDQAIHNYMNAGWVLVNRTDQAAQLKKPKRFNWFWFLFWLLIGLVAIGLPVILYLIYYAVKKDETVTLSVSKEGVLLINGTIPSPKPAAVPAPVDNRTPEERKAANRRLLIILGVVALVAFIVIPSLCWILSAIANIGQ